MPRYRRVQNITHNIGPSGSLEVRVTSADIRLTAVPGDGADLQATFEVNAKDEIEADAIFEASKMTVDASSGRLHVADDSGRVRGIGGAINLVLGGHHVELKDIEGSAPPAVRLGIQAVSGDVQATGFLGRQRYESVSGDLRLTDGGGELAIQSVSGDVSLRAVEPATMNVNTVSGDLSAEAPSFARLDLNAVSGDILVDGSLEDGVTHAVETVSGDLRLASDSGMTITVRGLASDVHSSVPHRLEGSADRRRLIVGDGTATLTFSSMSGDMSLTRSRQAASQTAAASTTARASTTAATASASASASASATSGGRAADPQTEVLAALERGEIDVDEAMRRLGGE